MRRPAAPRQKTNTETQRKANNPAILFDLDGTLLDSNYEHVLAWRLALRREGVEIPNAFLHLVSPSQATFLHDDDRVIGLVAGKLTKAYPAAILSQHGLVEDQSPEGPIAITW